MNLTDAGNTQGIVIDLTILLGYRVMLNVDYTDDTKANYYYWQAIKGGKIINADCPEELLGLATIIENEPDGVYYKNQYLEKKALEYVNSLSYKTEYCLPDYRASKKGGTFNFIYGQNPFSLLSMVGIAEKHGTQWQEHINNKNLDAVIEESYFEMPIEDFTYINGKGFVLCGQVREGCVYRGTNIRVLSTSGETKIGNITVNDLLPVFGYVEYAKKGDNICLNFFSPQTQDELQKLYPVEIGDIILYANIES